MENNQTSPEKTSTLVATLPFRSQDVHDPEANYDVSVWRSELNLCEFAHEPTACDTVGGLYYGSAEDPVTTFCPRHFYEMHGTPDAPYRLTDARWPSGHRKSPAEEALDAFWQAVVRRFPQAKTGDLSPLATVGLHRAAEAAVTEWIENNVPRQDHGDAA